MTHQIPPVAILSIYACTQCRVHILFTQVKTTLVLFVPDPPLRLEPCTLQTHPPQRGVHRGSPGPTPSEAVEGSVHLNSSGPDEGPGPPLSDTRRDLRPPRKEDECQVTDLGSVPGGSTSSRTYLVPHGSLFSSLCTAFVSRRSWTQVSIVN